MAAAPHRPGRRVSRSCAVPGVLPRIRRPWLQLIGTSGGLAGGRQPHAGSLLVESQLELQADQCFQHTQKRRGGGVFMSVYVTLSHHVAVGSNIHFLNKINKMPGDGGVGGKALADQWRERRVGGEPAQ